MSLLTQVHIRDSSVHRRGSLNFHIFPFGIIQEKSWQYRVHIYALALQDPLSERQMEDVELCTLLWYRNTSKYTRYTTYTVANISSFTNYYNIFNIAIGLSEKFAGPIASRILPCATRLVIPFKRNTRGTYSDKHNVTTYTPVNILEVPTAPM